MHATDQHINMLHAYVHMFYRTNVVCMLLFIYRGSYKLLRNIECMYRMEVS